MSSLGFQPIHSTAKTTKASITTPTENPTNLSGDQDATINRLPKRPPTSNQKPDEPMPFTVEKLTQHTPPGIINFLGLEAPPNFFLAASTEHVGNRSFCGVIS